MNLRSTTTKQKPTSSFTAIQTGLLQRKCNSCGQHKIAGGECTNCQPKSGLQRKLSIGASNDPLELEADRVADRVLATPTNTTISNAPPRIQRFTGQTAGQADVAPASVDRVLASPGRPLETSLQEDMGQRFGHDFSHVRVHTGVEADRSAQDINANAYTSGHNIVFGSGQFMPETNAGRRLIAHELTHIVQQFNSDKITFNSMVHRQQAPSHSTAPPDPIVMQQSGRTLVSVDNIVIAESSDILPKDISFESKWTPENFNIVVVIPENGTMFIIPGSTTDAALKKISTHFTLTIKKKSRVQRMPSEGEINLPPSYELITVASLKDQKPNSPPTPKTSLSPKASPSVVPQSTPPQTADSAKPGFVFQPLITPPTNLNLPPSLKYEKLKTDREIAQEKVNNYIKDAMSGRSNIPPPIGIPNNSLLNSIENGVIEAIKPLIRSLPKNVQDFVIDKAKDAIEKGILGIVESSLDNGKIDGPTKDAIKKAIEAGIKYKSQSAKQEQK